MRPFVTLHRWIAVAIAATLVAVATAACASGDSLTGKTWQWTAWSTVTPQAQEDVPDPSAYTIEFRTDGTFQAVADCNTVSGTYTSSASGGLKIYPGPSTLVACPEGSLGDDFVEKLGLAISYTFFRSEMTINQADLGTMTFE